MPEKIWLCWLEGRRNFELEEKYLSLRRLFVRGKNKISFVKFSEVGLKELRIFNGEFYKKVIFVGGVSQFLLIGRTRFFGVASLSQKTLKSKEPLAVCLGK